MQFISNDKQAVLYWEEFYRQVKNTTTIDINEKPEDQKKRIAKLEADPEKWFAYYFPNFYRSAPAKFHIDATNRIIKNPEWYEVRMWSRELAKSTRAMFEDLYLLLTKQKKYKLLISNSYENACRLLKPYIINLEANNRIINDYGGQERLGSWTEGEITTRTGFSIRALGKGQSPRGTRKDEQRPDIIDFDDYDTDESTNNPDTVEKDWKWANEAAIPTRSVSVKTLVRWSGNAIAEDCCVIRAAELADKVSKINIRDDAGKSVWAKNTEEMIDRILSTISYAAQQKEFYNNPYSEGKVFKEMVYGKCPPLRELSFVVIYADPAPSNKDRPGIKAKIQNSCKAVVIAGYHDNKYYIYKAFVDNTTNANFIDWLYAARKVVDNKTQPYFFIENNTLQNPFYEQVLLPLIFQQGNIPGNTVLSISPDDRQKPDKYFRIEGNLEPLNRNGLLILNEAEKSDPHMRRLEAQFKSVSANSKTMDGPDAVEGAIFKINEKLLVTAVGSIKAAPKAKNNKRY